MACENCRNKKIRCDSARPSCKHCDQRSLSCVYINERQKRRKLSGTEIEERFRQLECLVAQQAGATVSQEQAERSGEAKDTRQEPPTTQYEDVAVRARSVVVEEPLEQVSCYERERAVPGCRAEDCHDPALWLRLADGDEYTGPSSGISLLSIQGLEWIQGRLGERHCLSISTFEELRKNLLSHLRDPKCIVNDPWSNDAREGAGAPLPGPAEIWSYIDAYFDSVQTIFPILDRQQFVRRATGYLASPRDNDPSWYALFNAVLASGCRAALATESPEGFSRSGSTAWGFFKNALAVESDLIHKSTDFTAVQAFTVMAVYAQGLSSPQRLEYTFCSIAARLCYSLGMHRRPAKEWKLDFREQNERNRVFWIIYCLDKTIALRCGRPSIFDDDDISCEAPHIANTTAVRPSRNPAGTLEIRSKMFDFSKTYIELARIHGLVAKRLYSARALDIGSEHLADIATALLQDLETWRVGIPNVCRPGSPFRPSALSGFLSLDQGMALHLGYHDIICAIHRRFSPRFQRSEENVILGFLEGMPTHIEAAKQMILLTKYLDTQSYPPAWMLFYYPMTALLTAFEHVICDPGNESAKNDIALMEVVVGFFGRLEYLTSGVAAFTRTAEIIKQARIAVTYAQEDQQSAVPCDIESLATPADWASQSGSNVAMTQQEPVPHGSDEHTSNDTLQPEFSFNMNTPTRSLMDLGTDISGWSPSWNVPLDDDFGPDAASVAWTSMDTHVPESIGS